MKIKLYNKIAKIGLDQLPVGYEVGTEIEGEDGIVVRSADLHEVKFSENLKGIARAGAGVNNIPVEECSENGICVFNTPGANAEAVKELCIAALLMTSRKIEEGAEWTKTLKGNPDALKIVEKEKSKFQGPEILGKTLGIIGLGAIGSGLAKSANFLGMKVIGYDPFLKPELRRDLEEFAKITDDVDEIYKESDYISIHVPSLPTTRGMINKEKIALMRDGVRLLNLARADLINEEDVVFALNEGKISAYYTDFPTGSIAGQKGVVATPHLGASTPEAEDNCAIMACRQLREFLTTGNVVNSVNFPCVSMKSALKHRVSVFYISSPETESELIKILHGADKVSAVRGKFGYIIAESDEEFEPLKLSAVSGVKRVSAYK